MSRKINFISRGLWAGNPWLVESALAVAAENALFNRLSALVSAGLEPCRKRVSELPSKEFDTRMETLETRLRKLMDIEEIKQLKARYAAACDNNYDAEAIAELFTEDAVWDGGQFGKAEGRENIRRFFRHASALFTFAIHNVMNPRIEVDGERATAQWYLLQPATRQPGTQAVWLAAVYRDQYVRVGGKWLFKHLQVTSNFLTTYEEGWARKRFS